MENDISPKYLMGLIESINNTLWNTFQTSKYKNVRYYIEKWHLVEDGWNSHWENFYIFVDERKNIDLEKTLHNIDAETLIKIAIDLGLETPDFIPCISTFRNTLKDKYKSAIDTFNTAITNIEEKPDIAIGLANSTLESIIKEIIKEGKLDITYDENATLYKQTEFILKAFKIYPSTEIPKEIRTIGSSLLNISKTIEELRSNKTTIHGKVSSDYVIKEPLYAYFVVNSIATVGLFLDSFYKRNFLPEYRNIQNNSYQTKIDDLPF